ncbi:hypothetical protein JYU34_017719 [Plutella xylostella]|uniref:Uncharacterized protein n=2 Tax=Plutella xylostella TaxID=51655 RepID=A0ABQ7Q2L0_PLUXY|nr:hypothetical protein JYU34_017719 [Plutella xylostella]CAG9135735.1 unnamed protein product [Plutella xylostella]
MARGDECKTTSKANYACKNLDVSAPVMKKPSMSSTSFAAKKVEEKKNYGAWGPIFKDKKSFVDMHHC